MNQLEIEYKILITKEIFDQLLLDYPNHHQYYQRNDYITSNLLSEKKYSLRIRTKNNKYEMTLKRPTNIGLIETNIDIDEETKNKVLDHEVVCNEITDILEKEGLDITKMNTDLFLETYRHDIKLDEGMLSIDENHYLNHLDYELEFEVNDPNIGFKKFLEIIKPYHLEYTTNCDSKIKRVLAHS